MKEKMLSHFDYLSVGVALYATQQTTQYNKAKLNQLRTHLTSNL